MHQRQGDEWGVETTSCDSKMDGGRIREGMTCEAHMSISGDREFVLGHFDRYKIYRSSLLLVYGPTMSKTYKMACLRQCKNYNDMVMNM